MQKTKTRRRETGNGRSGNDLLGGPIELQNSPSTTTKQATRWIERRCRVSPAVADLIASLAFQNGGATQ